ncbi:hypothetical protein GQ651_16065 [Alphaproteobacteria bacterium GH1-50]|uniref:Uncharacterized protein n=1 Tax=Kangsaoukella pontilimi TaxID=2691042 RepID=A0A7C9IK60_9RHOB|nr:hypothetical protein [Kangsaoukella pontilimi]MXQ09362.1 hypothetical protein [Kangsaoukella pontilimi]
MRWSPHVNVAYLAAELQPFDQPGATAPRVTLADPGHRSVHMQQVRLWEDYPPDLLIFDRTYRWPLRHLDIDWVEVFADEPRITAVFDRFTPLVRHDTPRLTFEIHVPAD